MSELNLIDTYLGKNAGFGTDYPYYLESKEFVFAIACQNGESIQDLFENERINLRKKILIDSNEVKKQISNLKRDKSDFFAKRFLENVFVKKLTLILNCITELEKRGGSKYTKELIQNYHSIIDLYISEEPQIDFDKTEYFFNDFRYYYKIIIEKTKITDYFNNQIRRYVRGFDYSINSNRYFPGYDDPVELILTSFYRFCIEYKGNDFFDLIDSFDNIEYFFLLKELLSIYY